MSEPTVFERPFTAAYDEAITAFVVAHPEPGPTYAEIVQLLFPPEPPRPIVPRYDAPDFPRRTHSSVFSGDAPRSAPVSTYSPGLEPIGLSPLSLALGISLGAMFDG